MPHPENNERLLPALEQCPHMPTALPQSPHPKRLRATVNWLYYKDPTAARAFHEGALGMPLVCVQPGVADIYQTSPSGFFGAVDERVGMSDWAAPAAVMLSFVAHSAERVHAALASAFQSASAAGASPQTAAAGDETRSPLTVEPVDESDPRFNAFVSHDIEGYSLEWFELKATAVTAAHIAAVEAGTRAVLGGGPKL